MSLKRGYYPKGLLSYDLLHASVGTKKSDCRRLSTVRNQCIYPRRQQKQTICALLLFLPFLFVICCLRPLQPSLSEIGLTLCHLYYTFRLHVQGEKTVAIIEIVTVLCSLT